MEEDDQSRALSLIEEEIKEQEQLALILGVYCMTYLCKQPRRPNTRSGDQWVQEILDGHDARCHELFRVEKHVFHRLCDKLVDHGLTISTNIGIQEMVAMFLLTMGHAVGNRVIQEIFNHSGETISRHLHAVLEACVSLAREIIKPCDPEFRRCHPKIRNDRRYYPYFKDAIGAIDGTHIKCVVSGPTRDRYIGRKGYTTQNVMAVCDWDMCFTFVLAGWEGSAHDARVFHAAVSNPSMNFPHPPPGKYYLVDSGYPTPLGYLSPYRTQRYHLAEFTREQGFRNDQETFNYFHSTLRCTIERTFGVWKNRFNILQEMRSYKYATQVRIVVATMAIHNFIRRNSQSDVGFMEVGDQDFADIDDYSESQPSGSRNYTSVSSTQMINLRNTIRDQIVRDL